MSESPANSTERIPITDVRLSEPDAEQALQLYIFGGRTGGIRPPRGIKPDYVSQFVIDRLKPASPPDAYKKAGHVLRFYERQDVVPHLFLALNQTEREGTDLIRSALAVQAIGDLGLASEVEQAARYFDSVLVGHSAVSESVFPALIDALVPLTPAGTPDRLAARLADEVKRASTVPDVEGPAGIAHRRLQDLQDNRLRPAVSRVALKRKLLSQTPNGRRRDLVKGYQGEIGLIDPEMGVWAARMLRREAREGPPDSAEAVYAEFAKAIDSASVLPPERSAFLIRRAGQAILYLRGTLSPARRELYDKADDASLNFLWDDWKEDMQKVKKS